MKISYHHKKNMLPDLLICLSILCMAWAMKSLYSHADSRDFSWILRPTALLTESLSGITFESESGAGYLSREQRVLIAPECAGVNFLIIAFCMAVFQGIFRFGKISHKIGWTVAGALSAYMVTVCVNSIRIILSIRLYAADIYSLPWLTPERVHRMGGTAVYFLCLYLFYHALSMLLEKKEKIGKKENRAFPLQNLWPLFCYLFVSLGIPLLNMSWRKNAAQFSEHALSVLSVSVGLFLIFLLIQWGIKDGRSKQNRRQKTSA